VVVRHEIAKREAVVCGDEVDAGTRPSPIVLIEIGTAREAGSEFAERRLLAAPVVTCDVSVLSVPLGPEHRKVSDLIAAGPKIPWLGNQLHAVENGILMNDVEECRQPIDIVEFARQRRRQVEAESVDVHFQYPVSERIHHQLQRMRMLHVETVAGPGVIHVVPAVVCHRPVVRRFVQAFERQHGPEVVALGRMVVDDIEEDLEICTVDEVSVLHKMMHGK
jgi:hypothetical protein